MALTIAIGTALIAAGIELVVAVLLGAAVGFSVAFAVQSRRGRRD